MELLLIGIGGVCGAIARYTIGLVVAKHSSLSFPIGTYMINLTGAFLLGMSTAHTAALPLAQTVLERYGLQIGFIGAYTTFSTFGYEAIRLLEDGEWRYFFSYVAGSTILGLLACGAGYSIFGG
ncbi:fluoride efflux transporter CrcB [Methylomusa anaerophila]|nr:fluoride efflux transporter CrcB [Methylomusa anaerophila]